MLQLRERTESREGQKKKERKGKKKEKEFWCKEGDEKNSCCCGVATVSVLQ